SGAGSGAGSGVGAGSGFSGVSVRSPLGSVSSEPAGWAFNSFSAWRSCSRYSASSLSSAWRVARMPRMAVASVGMRWDRGSCDVNICCMLAPLWVDAGGARGDHRVLLVHLRRHYGVEERLRRVVPNRVPISHHLDEGDQLGEAEHRAAGLRGGRLERLA